MIMRFFRFAARLLVALSLFLVTAIAIVIAWLTTSLPQWNGTAAGVPVSHAAEILRDANGVTHIRAASERDAYVALGYAHAQDRLWQMDTYRRIGAGRMAEVVGTPGLTVDRFLRTLGVYRLAEQQVAEASPEVRDAIAGYTAGVNAYLSDHRGPWPPEFTVLGYAPEPWRPADSAVLGKLLGLMLGGNWSDELRRAALIERFGVEALDVLLPGSSGPAIVTEGAAGDVGSLLAGIPAWAHPRRASNAWAVAPGRAASGGAILASDPHLGLTAPGIWYLVRIETPDKTIVGATIPGLPFHLLAQNGGVAWGLTTTYGDVSDLVVETLADESGATYQTRDGPAPFRVREERIAVRFGRDVTLLVREGRYGPVVSDLLDRAASFAGSGRVAVLQAVALQEGDTTPEALYRMQRARSAEEFREALRYYHSPLQNVIYADRSGSIGFIAAGRIPIREKGDGSLPADAASGAGWRGFVPFDGLPQSLNPPSGRVLNANNRIVGDDFPYFISRDWEPSYRAQRLAELLSTATRGSLADHAAFQNDVHSRAAETIVPTLLARLDEGSLSAAARSAVAILKAWDFRVERDRGAPLVFAAWLPEITREVFADEMGDALPTLSGDHLDRALAVLQRGQHWCRRGDEPDAECRSSVTRALEAAVARLAREHGTNPDEWRWGSAHRARLIHPILFVPGFGRLFGTDVASDGDGHTLKRGGHGSDFRNGHAAGYRAVYDLAQPSRSLFSMLPGQSGNPFSRYFADQVADWRDGRYFMIPSFDEAAVGARGRLRLLPLAR
jgi:penicillin amidase